MAAGSGADRGRGGGGCTVHRHRVPKSWSPQSPTSRHLAGAGLEISLLGTELRAGRAAGRAGDGEKGKWRLVTAGCFWNFLRDGHCLTLLEPGKGWAGEVDSAVWSASRAVAST